MKLTTKFLENVTLPDGAKRKVYSDENGLRARVTTGRGDAPTVTFAVDYTVLGNRKIRTVGKFPTISLALARTIAIETQQSAAQGIDVVAEAKAEQEATRIEAERALSVSDCIDEHNRTHLVNLKAGGERLTTLRRELAAHLQRPIGDVNKVDLRAIIDRKARTASPTTANRLRAYLKKFFAWCAKLDYIEHDPSSSLPDAAKEVARDRVLSIEEIRLIYKAAETEWPAVQVLLLTGARRSEIAELCWAEVNLEARMIGLSGTRTKNGHPHLIPMCQTVHDLIKFEGVGAPDDFVFQRRVLNRVKDHLPTFEHDYRLHDFRRAFSTHMSDLELCDILTAELCLGHSMGRAVEKSVEGETGQKVRGGGKVGAIYNRAQRIKQRIIAMDNWEKLVTTDQAFDDNVVQFDDIFKHGTNN